MKKGYVYLGAVLDRSGSMLDNNKILEAQNGFNNLIEEKKKQPFIFDVYLTIFDAIIETLYEGSINNCPKLTNKNFFPRGMTSLYDAMGTTILKIGNKLKNFSESERPEKVIICIITDGEENSSSEFKDPGKLKDLIEQQKKVYSWEFIFMGTSEKAITQAKNVGVNNTLQFKDSCDGVKHALFSYSESIDNITRSL